MYANAVKEKQKMTKQAGQCKKKMTAASTLINGLGGEKVRWTQQSKEFKQQLIKLVGDTLLACSFLGERLRNGYVSLFLLKLLLNYNQCEAKNFLA